MEPHKKIARPSLIQISGIVACAGAAGPVFLLMYTFEHLLRGLDDAAEIWGTPLPDLMLGSAVASLLTLPTALMIAIGSYVLGRRKKDTFTMSIACGAAICFIGISITSEILVGGSPLREPHEVRSAALLMLGSLIMSSLYWLVAARRIRIRRKLVDEYERALRAME